MPGPWFGVDTVPSHGRPADETLVFAGETKPGYLSPSTILRRELYPAMVRANVPRVGPTGEKRTFHSFRHTFAKRAHSRSPCSAPDQRRKVADEPAAGSTEVNSVGSPTCDRCLGGFDEVPATEPPGGQADDDREQHCPTAVDELPGYKGRKSCGAGYESSTNRSGADGVEETILAGEAVYWHEGEEHEAKSSVGLTALVIEGKGLDRFRARPVRVT